MRAGKRETASGEREGSATGIVTRNRALLLSVFLLLLNDFVLKARFPGFVTGKLSDLAGLFAFVLFWRSILPRHARAVAVTTALGFVWWKSPWSGPAIAAWNALDLWNA